MDQVLSDVVYTAPILSQEAADDAVVQVLDAAAGDADQVVMVALAADPIVEVAVLQEDTADDADLRQKLHGPEDGGPPHSSHLAHDVVDGEMAGMSEHSRYHRQAGRRDAVALVLQPLQYGL